MKNIYIKTLTHCTVYISNNNQKLKFHTLDFTKTRL